MADGRVISCPHCHAELLVPRSTRAVQGRCPTCHADFPLPPEEPDPRQDLVTDATIADWLGPRDEDEAPDAVDESALTDVAEGVHRELGDTHAQTVRCQIRLVRLDAHGALFEFPASRLQNTVFRCAMPRRCLHCGTTSHLQAHVIVFGSRFTRDMSLKAEHSAGRLVASERDIAGLEGEALLERLPHVPNVDPPADLPMPYWLCDMCTGAGEIKGEIETNPATGRGRCRLLIRNLRRAEEFLVAAGGNKTIDHRQLRRRVEAMDDNLWDTLPLAVRHRIEQWFRPHKGERLIAFVPDRDHARTEDGVAGLILSNRRLIHHTSYRHSEASVGTPLEMRLAFGQGKATLQINASDCNVKRMCLDREGVRTLRSALSESDFHVAWR
ncbi:MAG: hypothetical protein KGY99_07255 [Phycisphaerae bacterium]|nr:hypothetical protein [Phycisphaerae bacterium]